MHLRPLLEYFQAYGSLSSDDICIIKWRNKIQAVQLSYTNGFQLGFINIAENGFLPVFPFFNFPTK